MPEKHNYEYQADPYATRQDLLDRLANLVSDIRLEGGVVGIIELSEDAYEISLPSDKGTQKIKLFRTKPSTGKWDGCIVNTGYAMVNQYQVLGIKELEEIVAGLSLYLQEKST